MEQTSFLPPPPFAPTWPVESRDIPAPTFENPNRCIARYRLPDEVIQKARDISAGGE